MVSLADKVEVPSEEKSTRSHKHTKGSSNDSDSGEARSAHKRKKSGSPRAEAQGVDGSMSERPSNAEPQDLEALKTPDELLLMEMSEEERIFYGKEKDSASNDLKCTKCSMQLFLSKNDNIKIHPALGVLICKSCHEFYTIRVPCVQDSNGKDKLCRWCAKHGDFIWCNNCPHVFCKACLMNNLGLFLLVEIFKPGIKWSCLSCNKKPIWTQRTLCRKVFMAIKEDKLLSGKPLQTRSAGKSSDPTICLPSNSTSAIASIIGNTLEDKLIPSNKMKEEKNVKLLIALHTEIEAELRATRVSKLAKPGISGTNSSRSDSKSPKPSNQPKEDVGEKRAARMALLESDDDGDTSNSKDKVLQQVKAASSNESSAGASLTLDNPKLHVKKKKKTEKGAERKAAAHAGGLMPGFKEILESLDGQYVAGVPLISVAETILKSNPGITQDDFLGRFRSSVELLEKQEVAAAAVAAPPPPAPNPVQQKVDPQRTQMGSEQTKWQFGIDVSQPTSAAGPCRISATPSAHGRPPISPYQRTDLHGVNPMLAAKKPPGGSPSVPNPKLNPSSKI